MSLLFPAVPGAEPLFASSLTSSPRPSLDFPTSPSNVHSSTFFSSLNSSNRVARDPVASTSARLVPHIQPFPSAPRPRTDGNQPAQAPAGSSLAPPQAKTSRSKRLSFISALSSTSSSASSGSNHSSPTTGYSFSSTPPLSPKSAPLSRSSSAHTRTSSTSSPPNQDNNNLANSTSLPYYNPTVTETMDEETCPVCCEDLSMRLQGEKPHVVPVCGHRLHRACFEAVYGEHDRVKPGSMGLCGVCRRNMKLGDQSAQPGRKDKFAAMAGIQQPEVSHKMHSLSKGTINEHDSARHDPAQDDDLVQLPAFGSFPSGLAGIADRHKSGYSAGSSGASTVTGSSRRGSDHTAKALSSSSRGILSSNLSASNGVLDIVKPIITVRAEQPTVERTLDHEKKQHLTCMVTIEMPSKWPTPRAQIQSQGSLLSPRSSHGDLRAQRDRAQSYGSHASQASGSTQRPMSQSTSAHSFSGRPSSPTSVYSAFSHGQTAPAANPFAAVVEDLQARMADWKGHSPDEFGLLKLYDFLHVRKKTNVREFLVYLFEEAILCVADDKRKGGVNEGKLRLKGRVYVRHIRSVVDSSTEDELSLTINMSEDALEEFVMTFTDRSSLETWRHQIEALLAHHRHHGSPRSAPPPAPSSGLARAPPMAQSGSSDSMIGSEYSVGSGSSMTHSSGFSGYTRTTTSSAAHPGTIHEDKAVDEFGTPLSPYSSYGQASTSSAYPTYHSSVPLSPRDFTPLDLMLIMALPGPSGPSSLKMGIIKSSLDFLLHNVGPRTRVSIIAFSAGEGPRGTLRKTPFIALGKAEGRRRLEQAVGELGLPADECRSLIDHKEDRVNVVTAVNLALDILLKRKAKSALTGVVLMNDARDGAQKQQMDLVMARAEAANVPIHAVGWGKSHDPTSLWVLSNHTGGTYTFLREFYDLRDGLAGIVGGILSIAASNVKLHIGVPESRWVRIRKVAGATHAIVSSEGKDVDINIGELRFGERKDLLVEVEMSLAGYGEPRGRRHEHNASVSTATDAFFLNKVGLDPLALEDYNNANFYEDEYDGLPDEIPLFEVNAAYRDPSAGKNVSRLNHSPCLLTISVVPPAPSPSRKPPPATSPDIVRRRMELLTSDMLSRALLLMTRRNDAQAERLLRETARIIATIAGSLNQQPMGRGRSISGVEDMARATLQACAEDVQAVLEGCMQRDAFDSHIRNLAAQQAVVLRDQRSWTPRTATERRFWQADNSVYMVALSQQWVSARSYD